MNETPGQRLADAIAQAEQTADELREQGKQTVADKLDAVIEAANAHLADRLPRCSNCRHWEQTKGMEGRCRRHPPWLDIQTLLAQVLNARDVMRSDYPHDQDKQSPYDEELIHLHPSYGVWPVTTSVDWCGEWSAHPKPVDLT